MKKETLSKGEAINSALRGMLENYKLPDTNSPILTNTNNIIKKLASLYRVAYVYTFDFKVYDKTKSYDYDGVKKIDESDTGGIYKVWFDKDDVTLNYTPTTLKFGFDAYTLTQNQIMYIYSNCPLDFPDSATTGSYAFIYHRNEHLSYYELTCTGNGYVLFRGIKNSINEIGYDDDYDSESDFANNLFKVTFDYDGTLTLSVYHDNLDEDIQILESSNCTVGQKEKDY